MEEKIICDHCGADCGKHPIVSEGNNFCCNGCKAVYQLLNDHQLIKYYEIENHPGIKTENNYDSKYAFLDLVEIQEKLIQFKIQNSTKVTFYVPEIHCASCIWLLENLHTIHSGVQQSLVNFIKKEVSITFNTDEISLRQLAELLASIHYAPEINLENLDHKENLKINRSLLFKIGVAAFGFGNIMLISLPEYLSHRNDLDPTFKIIFAWINLVLALPIFFYSGSDYLLSAWKNIRKGVINLDLPVAIGILALFSQSTYEVVTQSGPGYFDSLAGFVFFLLIGKWYQSYTYQALSFERDYKSYFPVAVTKITDKLEEVIPLDQLQKGDRILIRNNELIPADAKLRKGVGNIDYSFVTGETSPVKKLIDEPIYAGGRQLGEAIEIEILKKVEQSQLTQLWNEFDTKETKYTGLTPIIDNVSKYFTIIVLSIAAAATIYWSYTDGSKAILILTSVLIVACPCALALSIPFAFGNIMRVFGKKGFYLKNTQVVELLSKIKSIVFDKTGTITHTNILDISYHGKELNQEELSMVNSMCRQSTHPMSVALYKHLNGYESSYVDRFEEIAGKGTIGFIGNKEIRIGAEHFVNHEIIANEVLKSKVHVEIDGQYKGFFGLDNHYREGTKKLFNQIRHDYDLHLLSGDNDSEKDNLLEFFPSNKQILFNQSPQDKLNYLENISRTKNQKVMMIGDGLNDAGALSKATVGISIADDIYQFSPACDAILESNRFGELNNFIIASRKSMIAVYISFGISILYNIIGISFAITGNLSPIFAAILMPISSVTVVAFATASTSLIGKHFLK
ncbi:MAG: heavy metal translocating P-type ATPase metal-binding domain-containing protein [Bacteroidales bacterium]|nr:heavy metal translocating P-type ATPase metal-binding domain-containing protein [Bacteroidales bacterium]